MSRSTLFRDLPTCQPNIEWEAWRNACKTGRLLVLLRVRNRGMPLSEDEQRILNEIEQSFHESDPKLAREVGETTVYRHAVSSLKLPILGIVVGLVFMVLTLSQNYILAFFGFILMFLSGLALAKKLKFMGMIGAQQVTKTLKEVNFPRKNESE